MKTFFTKKLIPTAAVLITMMVIGLGSFARPAQAALHDIGNVSVARMLSYTSNGHGTISGSATQVVPNGGSGTTVTAVPSIGYVFSSWSDGVTSASRTDTNVTASIAVSATFTLNVVQVGNLGNQVPVGTPHTVTYSGGTHGSIFGFATQTVPFGGNATTVLAVPNQGYQFVRWSDNVMTTSRTDTNVTSNITVSAIFAMSATIVNNPNIQNLNPNVLTNLTTYVLSYSAPSSKGAILGTNPQTINAGATGQTVTAIPKVGYTFTQWSDGVTSASRTDSNVQANLNVTAQFTSNPIVIGLPTQFSLIYSVPSGRGYIQGAESQVVSEGEDGSTVKAIANNGYHFTRWSDGLTTATRRDTDVSEDLELSALFSSNSSGGNNSGSQSAGQILGSGTCPLDLMVTQNLKSGAHDGEYLKYNGGVVNQVNILQKQINRILAASYSQAAGPTDGRFGPLTKLGVQRLQLALVDNLNANLGPKGADGVVGAFTKAAINNSCGGM